MVNDSEVRIQGLAVELVRPLFGCVGLRDDLPSGQPQATQWLKTSDVNGSGAPP